MGLFLSTQVYNCFAYGRLSKEDGDKPESDSITNQRELVRSFIADRSDLRLTMEGYDDGYTGTNFQRPQMELLLAAVKAKQVNCVVVKDLSRFGREYIQTGTLIFNEFPAAGVRFIAINDGYDSLTSDPSGIMMLLFKNIINDSYCRDASVKIRSHFDVKRRKGDFIGSFAVYGYAKHPDNKNKLVVDLEAAEVVRDIFSWRIHGLSCQAVANRLNESGILSPMEYKRQCGLKYASGYQVHSKPKWTAVAVRRILENPVYLGIMEQGKRTTPNYKVKAVVHRPAAEWFRVEGTHEAIVSGDDFDLVARLMQRDTRAAPGEAAVYALAGLLCCGDCKGTMARKTTTSDGKKYAYYVCGTHRGDKSTCFAHNVSEHKLEAAVLVGINLHMRAVLDLQAALQALSSRPLQKIELQRLDHQLAALGEELAQKRSIQDSLYRRFALGEVAEDDFLEFKRIFSQDCAAVEASILVQQSRAEALLSSGDPEQPWMHHFRTWGQLASLDRESAVRFLDRVLIYDDERIEIVFRHQTEFDMAMGFVAIQHEAQQLREVV